MIETTEDVPASATTEIKIIVTGETAVLLAKYQDAVQHSKRCAEAVTRAEDSVTRAESIVAEAQKLARDAHRAMRDLRDELERALL